MIYLITIRHPTRKTEPQTFSKHSDLEAVDHVKELTAKKAAGTKISCKMQQSEYLYICSNINGIIKSTFIKPYDI